MSKQKIGIQENLTENPSGVKMPRFDARPTAKVEETRAPKNGKYFRTRQQREIAKTHAEKQKSGKYKGTFVHFGDGTQRSVHG